MKLKRRTIQIFDYVKTILIMPITLVQAIWVKLTVLRLPEPNGKRSGICGEGKNLRLLIIGDSAAAGVGVNTQLNAISGQLAKELAAKYNVDWQLVASNGSTSSDIANELSNLTEQKFDYVLISVGVNDVTNLTKTSEWTTNIKNIVKLLSTNFGAPKIIFSAVPPMHLFNAIPFPLSWWLGKRVNKLNELMIHTLKAYERSVVLKFDLPFKPEYLAKDGIHPSKLAYETWAKQVANEISKWDNI